MRVSEICVKRIRVNQGLGVGQLQTFRFRHRYVRMRINRFHSVQIKDLD